MSDGPGVVLAPAQRGILDQRQRSTRGFAVELHQLAAARQEQLVPSVIIQIERVERSGVVRQVIAQQDQLPSVGVEAVQGQRRRGARDLLICRARGEGVPLRVGVGASRPRMVKRLARPDQQDELGSSTRVPWQRVAEQGASQHSIDPDHTIRFRDAHPRLGRHLLVFRNRG